MNASKTLMLTVAAAAAGFVLAWVLFGAGPAGRNAGAGAEREILYWVAPMDPNYRSDGPGKSPMGMDLVPVYADERGGRGVGASYRAREPRGAVFYRQRHAGLCAAQR